MRRYAITDRRLFAGSAEEQGAALVLQVASWARAGVDWIQLREKDLEPEALAPLAQQVVEAARRAGSPARVVVNGPAVVALAADADGVHVPVQADDLARRVEQARDLCGPRALVSVSCHTPGEAATAREAGVSVILFAPVFEKPLWREGQHRAPSAALAGAGLPALAAACTASGQVPVFALGGVTLENAAACIEAGAAGVAGIRLFAGGDWLRLGESS